MNQMTHTSNAFRFTTLNGYSGATLFSGNGQESASVGGQIGVDEFVFDASNGTVATFQDSPSLLQLLNSRDGACSFVI
jgi:hypothetical protein